MPDPIPVQPIQPIDLNKGIQAYSNILGIQQQKQALSGQSAQVQQEQQTAQQRAALAKVDWSKFDDGTGVMSVDKALSDPELRQAAGDTWPDLVPKLAQIRSTQIQHKQQLANLNGTLRDQFASTMGALRNDPDVVADKTDPQSGVNPGREKVSQAIQAWADSGGPDAQRIGQIYGPLVQHVPPGKMSKALSTVQLQAMTADTQAQREAPSYQTFPTGAKDIVKQVNPQGPSPEAAPGEVTKQVPPGMNTFQDQGGNTWAFNPQKPGQATLVGRGGSAPNTSPNTRSGNAPTPQPANASTGPHMPPYMAPGASQNATQSAMNDEQTYSAIKGAADKGPVTKNILSNIATLAGQTATGGYSKEIANAEAALSEHIPGLKSAADNATKRQLLGKYVQQLLLQTEQANGASTDAAQAHVAAAIPDPDHMTGDAIKQAARLVQAQTHIAQARGAVAEKYRSDHNGSSQGLRAVDSSFMQNVDPRAFDYIGLSKADRQKFLQDTFGNGSAQRKKFADSLSVIDHYGGFDYAR